MTLNSVVSRINWNIKKSTTQNTEGELYLRTGKREIIINRGSGKIISPKKNTILSVWLVAKINININIININLCPIEAATAEVL